MDTWQLKLSKEEIEMLKVIADSLGVEIIELIIRYTREGIVKEYNPE